MPDCRCSRRAFGGGATMVGIALTAGCLGDHRDDENRSDEAAPDQQTESPAETGDDTAPDTGSDSTVFPLLLVDPDRYDGGRTANPAGLVVQLHSSSNDHFH